MVRYLTDAEHRGDYRFWVRFNSGEEGEVDLEEVLVNAPGSCGQRFEKAPETAADYYLDPWPTLAWECGYDIAPERLYEIFLKQNAARVAEGENDYQTPE